MANLIKSLGIEYCSQMMHGAYLNVNGEVHWFDNIIENNFVQTIKLSGNPDKVAPEAGKVPWEFFKGWSALSYPTLGYRMAGNGQILVYITRINSVRRGLCSRDVQVDFHNVSFACNQNLGIDLNHYIDDYTKACLVMNPQYTSLSKGLKAVAEGTIPAFCLSADFAVAPNDEVPYLEVLFRQRRIGTVAADGTIELVTQNIKHSWETTVANGEKTDG